MSDGPQPTNPTGDPDYLRNLTELVNESNGMTPDPQVVPEGPTGTIFELDLFAREGLDRLVDQYESATETVSIPRQMVIQELRAIQDRLRTLIDNCHKQYIPLADTSQPNQEDGGREEELLRSILGLCEVYTNEGVAVIVKNAADHEDPCGQIIEHAKRVTSAEAGGDGLPPVDSSPCEGRPGSGHYFTRMAPNPRVCIFCGKEATPNGDRKESEVVGSTDDARVAVRLEGKLWFDRTMHPWLGERPLFEQLPDPQRCDSSGDHFGPTRITIELEAATRAKADSEATTTITAGEAQPITKTACGYCRGKDNGFPCPHCAAQAKEVK